MKRSLCFVILLLALMPFVAQAQEEVTLEVWILNYNWQTQQFIRDQLIPEFEAAHPHIKVDIRYQVWTAFYDRLGTAFAAGVAPDIYQAGSSWRGPAATQGFAMPITKYTEAWPDKEEFFPGSWAAVHWEGEDYGIPALTAPRSILYRTDALMESAYDPDNNPTHWDDMLAAVKRLTKVDQDGRVTRRGMFVPPADLPFFMPLIWQAGGEVTTSDASEPLFNTPEGWKAAEYYLELYETQNSYGTMPEGTLASGAVAMQYGNLNVVASMRNQNPSLGEDDIRVGYPMEESQQATAIYTDSFFVSPQTQHPDAAWEFLKWFGRLDNITAYNETLWFLPPRRDSLDTDYVAQHAFVRDTIQKVMPYGIVNPAFSTGASSALAGALKQIFNEGEVPRNALETAERAWLPLEE